METNDARVYTDKNIDDEDEEDDKDDYGCEDYDGDPDGE